MQEQGKVKRERERERENLEITVCLTKNAITCAGADFHMDHNLCKNHCASPPTGKNKTHLGQPGSIQKQTVAHQGFPFYLKIRKTKGNEHRKTTRTEETLRENLHQIKGNFNYIVILQEVHFCVMETTISLNGLFENITSTRI